MDRQTIRDTAGRVHRSDELATDEKENAADFLRANPTLGNPHVVRCDWCHETSVLFRDEDRGAFTRAGRGWRCNTCSNHAASQEVRF
ncbi:MAG TPA: hypothetical protein VII32_14135 [Thermoanaerobaculia bacterium]|jgi:hypothetical protein